MRQALAAVAKAAYAADPRAYVERGRHEREDRHVTLRPAPDTMSVLSGYLPVEQGVACLAALKRHTDSAVAGGDARSRGQIMAGTLVERVTGQARAGDVAVEIQLVVPTDARPEGSEAEAATAALTGAGALPRDLAAELVDASAGAKHVRLLRRSAGGHLVGIGARRRFTGALADLVVARDQTCREPYCDAPIRHLDHVERHSEGGGTDLANGRGLCARHNLAREQAGERRSSTTAWASTRTQCAPPPRPGIATSVVRPTRPELLRTEPRDPSADEAEGVPGGVEVDAEAAVGRGLVGVAGRAELEHAGLGGVDVADGEVEVHLLRVRATRPGGRHVVLDALEGDRRLAPGLSAPSPPRGGTRSTQPSSFSSPTDQPSRSL